MRRIRRDQRSVALACLLLLASGGAEVAMAQTTGENGSELEKCDRPVGTLAVVEPQDEVITALTRYRLQSPTGLIRLMVQQSNCFQVVERGAGMRNMMQERELARSGELQATSNVGPGQMRAADFILTPNVLFSEGNAGGVGGAIGGFLGRRAPVLGAVAGGLKFKEAQTNILIADTRSGLQVAAAEGKARKTNFSLGALGYTGGMVGAVGGYTNTNEGKVVAASFLDNYNAVVRAVRADPSLQRTVVSNAAAASSATRASNPAGAGNAPLAGSAGPSVGAAFAEGDVLIPKIANVRLLAGPTETAHPIGVVGKGDELVSLGEEKSGYIHVQGGTHEGWVRKTLVRKQ